MIKDAGLIVNLLTNCNGVLCYTNLYNDTYISNYIIINNNNYKLISKDYFRFEGFFLSLFILEEKLDMSKIKIGNKIKVEIIE